MRGDAESRFTSIVALADFLGGNDCPEILMSSTSGNALPELSTLKPWAINPSGFASLPSRSRAKLPLRVYSRAFVLGSLTIKNPSPSMARSPGNEVDWNAPWVNTGDTLETNTPRPICSVPPVPELWLKTSEKLPRLSLKPVVLTLAMLLPMTEMAFPYASNR